MGRVKTAFESWKECQFPGDHDIYDTYHQTHKEYRTLLHNFLNDVEIDKIKKLCSAAYSDEKSSWKLLKGQCSSSQMSAFLVDSKLITEKNLICKMWADHFETLGTLPGNMGSDGNFLARVAANVQNIYNSSIEDPSGALCAWLHVFAPV